MYSHSSFNVNKDKDNVAPKGLTAILIGIIVCYQVANHIFLHKAVSDEDAELESDSACTAVAGPGGSYSCMEAKLFKGWRELPDEQLLAVSHSEDSTTSIRPTAAQSESQGLRGDRKANTEKDTTASLENLANSEVKPEALEGLLWDLAWQMGGGDKSHSAPDKFPHKAHTTQKPNAFMAKAPKKEKKKKSFAQGLTELQQKLEAKMQAQAKRHAEHRKIRALHVAANGHSQETSAPTDTMTPWAHNLDDLTHDMQAQMHTWRKERAEHARTHAAKVQSTEDTMTPWAHKLDDQLHEMQEHMEHRNKERAEHEAAHKAAHEARMAALHKATAGSSGSSFMDEIDSLGRELCQDPERRKRPSCAQFLPLHSTEASTAADSKEETAADVHASAMAHIKLLERHLGELEKDREHDNEEIRQESQGFLKELCADPARHSYPACARVLAEAAPASGRLRASSSAKAPESPKKSVSKAAAREFPHVLRWSPSKESEDKAPHHVDEMPLLMSRKELIGAHWEGKVPTVACVTVLPEGQVTETLMRYFMDNYKLQHYEGKYELVLVYSQTDKEASRIAHLYADGSSIKAVAARGGDEFPSATAFRYGAWVAHDADIVVRYDFEGWHHPNRLSMQVRAMVLSKRPASLVTMVTAFDADGKQSAVVGGAGPHGSMMGEAAWMRKHWMPVLEEETSVLHGLQSRDVVQVAMPDLLAYHDASMLEAKA